jgi:hypothetical protein
LYAFGQRLQALPWVASLQLVTRSASAAKVVHAKSKARTVEDLKSIVSVMLVVGNLS